MKIARIAFLTALAPAIICASPFDPITEVELGGELKAQFSREHGSNVLHLPGKNAPIEFGREVYAVEAALSPDRRLLAVILFQSSGVGSNYFATLVCQRSNTTATAEWSAYYTLFAVELDLKFGLQTWIDGIHSVSNEGTAILMLAQAEKRDLPTRILRFWEEWSLEKEERLRKIKEAEPFEKYEE